MRFIPRVMDEPTESFDYWDNRLVDALQQLQLSKTAFQALEEHRKLVHNEAKQHNNLAVMMRDTYPGKTTKGKVQNATKFLADADDVSSLPAVQKNEHDFWRQASQIAEKQFELEANIKRYAEERDKFLPPARAAPSEGEQQSTFFSFSSPEAYPAAGDDGGTPSPPLGGPENAGTTDMLMPVLYVSFK